MVRVADLDHGADGRHDRRIRTIHDHAYACKGVGGAQGVVYGAILDGHLVGAIQIAQSECVDIAVDAGYG